ncbi:MAG: hypothetical protein KAW12_21400 [Candidatus Aminicenantes bacterium]|nr:hypothetical protein [Candidatus Aminicenantes bacterium]
MKFKKLSVVQDFARNANPPNRGKLELYITYYSLPPWHGLMKRREQKNGKKIIVG